jgi:hypothetical protein
MDYTPDEATISRFCSMTGCERAHAHFLLECCNGNIENAIAMFFGGYALAELSGASRGANLGLHRAR